MSNFKVKSDQNKRAADFLINNHEQACWPTVIHSSYYSCLLLIRHKLIYGNYYTVEQIKEQENLLGKGTNGTVVYLATTAMGEKISKYQKEFNNFNEFIHQLTQIRTVSDYYDQPVDQPLAKKALDLCNKINVITNKLM